MPDYRKSVIYKIYDNTNGDVYYGSTCNELRYRISAHKTKGIQNGTCKSKSIILNGDYTYSIVEKYPCDTKLELHTRERWWIENNICINKIIPTRTAKERQERAKQYRIDNADKIKEDRKQNRIDNADKIKEDKKQYRIRNTVYCICGGHFTKDRKSRHLNTKQHQNYIKDIPIKVHNDWVNRI